MTCHARSGAPAIFQSFVRIDAGSIPGWNATEQRARNRCGRQAKEQHWNIQCDVGFGGKLARRQPVHKQPQEKGSQRDAESTTDSSKDQILSEKLAKELASGRAH